MKNILTKICRPKKVLKTEQFCIFATKKKRKIFLKCYLFGVSSELKKIRFLAFWWKQNLISKNFGAGNRLTLKNPLVKIQ